MLLTTPITSNNPEIIKRFRRSMRRRNVCKLDADTALHFIRFLRYYRILIFIYEGKLFIGKLSDISKEDKFIQESKKSLFEFYQDFLDFTAKMFRNTKMAN